MYKGLTEAEREQLDRLLGANGAGNICAAMAEAMERTAEEDAELLVPCVAEGLRRNAEILRAAAETINKSAGADF